MQRWVVFGCFGSFPSRCVEGTQEDYCFVRFEDLRGEGRGTVGVLIVHSSEKFLGVVAIFDSYGWTFATGSGAGMLSKGFISVLTGVMS